MKATLRRADFPKLTFCCTLLLAALIILTLTSQSWPGKTQPTGMPETQSRLSDGHTAVSRAQLPTARHDLRLPTYSPTPAPTRITSASKPVLAESAPPKAESPTLTPAPMEKTATMMRPPPVPILTHSVLTRQFLGLSSQGWPIEAYRIGQGPRRLAFIGGIHGGYEWNTIVLAYRAISFFASHPEQVPVSISLYIVPAANPDGQAAVVGHAGRFEPSEITSDTMPGRFNGNGVDLNRNWDCEWTPTGFWGDQEVSAGSAPFSEAETQILRDFITTPPMEAVVFWHSAKPGVFAGGCDAPSIQANALANVYALGARYPLLDEFSDYSVTGDASDWLSSQGIPAIVVELTNHTDTDWPRNLAGMQAVIEYFAHLRNIHSRKADTVK
jgi:hypothetical protein